MRSISLLLCLVLTACAGMPPDATGGASSSFSSASSLSASGGQRSSDGRLVFDDDAQQAIMDILHTRGCDNYEEPMGGELNFDPPTTTVFYQSDDYAFSAELPFNPAWGSPAYAALPYEERIVNEEPLRTWVGFGPVGLGEGCGFMRGYDIRSEEWKTIDELIIDSSESLGAVYLNEPIPEDKKPKVIQIGDRKGVVMYLEGFCASSQIAVPGPLYTHYVASTCGGGDQAEIDFLTNVAASMKFFDAQSVKTPSDDLDQGSAPAPRTQ